MIREYTANGFFEDAIGCYLKLLNYGIPTQQLPFFPSLIKAFAGLLDLRTGRQIHGHVLKFGLFTDVYVANSLLALYWKCGAFEDALHLFDNILNRDSVSWNTMISGFDQSVLPLQALTMFRRMVRQLGAIPNRVACLSALSSCSSSGSLLHGKEIHAFVIKNGLDLDPSVVNELIGMYMKGGQLRNAEHVFRIVLEREPLRENTLIWNAMISGYIFNGCFWDAFTLFQKMLMLGINLDSSTMVTVLVLCSHLLDLKVGRQIHGYIVRIGLKLDARIETAILDMYCKCGEIQDGLNIFGRSSNVNFVMWGAVIAGCAQNGRSTKALELFSKFRVEGGLVDPITLLAVLRACSSLTLMLNGMETHGLALKMGFSSDVFIGGALTDMYAKCGDIESAQRIFLGLSARDVVSWNALLSGYAQNDYADETLKAFHEMQDELVRPNTVTFASILSVCARLSALILCKQIHCYLIRNRFDANVLVSNSLISAYARCGDINSALILFNGVSERNEISWNSMIAGLGIHGHMDGMLALFDKMKAADKKPDHVTFTAILSACSHAGRVDEGWRHFRSMVKDYNLKPELEHYTCMVDLLGRAGHLDEAFNMIMDMPCQPDAHIWGSLLASCKIHCNEEMAERAANHLFKLDSSSMGYQILLSNIYEDFGRWDNVTRIRTEIKDMGLKKKPGCSWIVVDHKLNVFVANDRSHYQSEQIYATIVILTEEITGAGYIPQLYPLIIQHDETSGEGIV
ncbi:pentatricopeptide repeat-containing protein At4g21300-like isoform X2 [Telopea speciosissima]|uniref:pentatricopeptide repeat-containing protein At4g21300-like isoform X2 n=2 Tax=Telopea speciosissima TaxID=54955 RepID=UPI001CC6B97A|nr:pentatricopeptide repeat-containing protein At4g21300-like isoform X2 [Telopea speciosissima]